MKADKGTLTMNVIFGAFLLMSMVRTGIAIYDWKEKRKGKKKCNCSGK